ncbi:MAG: DsrE/DsrF/DrsH-like family protein [Pseudomonadota bacterium]
MANTDETVPLFILLCAGEHERVQMAAMSASVAAVSERTVEVFVSMNALGVFYHGDDQVYQGGEFSQRMLEKGAPDPIELLKQGREFGELRMIACAMSAEIADKTLQDFIPGLFDEIGGLTRFLADAERGQLIVF